MKYNSLKELRLKKELLRKEVSDLEDLITFENPKESLSAITHGFTDRYLTEEIDEEGNPNISLNTENIIKQVGNGIKNKVTKNSIIQFSNTEAGVSLADNALKIGLVSLAGNFARKSLADKSWKKKAIGLALIYVAPYALKFLREKLDEYQRNKTTNSLKQLI